MVSQETGPVAGVKKDRGREDCEFAARVTCIRVAEDGCRGMLGYKGHSTFLGELSLDPPNTLR